MGPTVWPNARYRRILDLSRNLERDRAVRFRANSQLASTVRSWPRPALPMTLLIRPKPEARRVGKRTSLSYLAKAHPNAPMSRPPWRPLASEALDPSARLGRLCRDQCPIHHRTAPRRLAVSDGRLVTNIPSKLMAPQLRESSPESLGY
jgi:hypothetical protein